MIVVLLVVVVAWLAFGIPFPRRRRRKDPWAAQEWVPPSRTRPSFPDVLAARYDQHEPSPRVELHRALGQPAPDTSWVETECVCCPGSPVHLSRWRKLRDRLP